MTLLNVSTHILSTDFLVFELCIVSYIKLCPLISMGFLSEATIKSLLTYLPTYLLTNKMSGQFEQKETNKLTQKQKYVET